MCIEHHSKYNDILYVKVRVRNVLDLSVMFTQGRFEECLWKHGGCMEHEQQGPKVL
jgi:hypothetical protein